MPLALVIGASRGLGLELVRQYRTEGWDVLATVRDAKGLERLRALGAEALTLDVTAADAGTQLEAALGARAVAVAILSAGIYGPRTQALEPPEETVFAEVMRTNVLPAMRIAPQLLAALERGRGKFAVLSSRMGSIGTRSGTFGWLYRASKAALNSVLKDISLVAGARGIACVAFHPGWARTDMGGEDAPHSAQDSVARVRGSIARLDFGLSGKFLSRDGDVLPW